MIVNNELNIFDAIQRISQAGFSCGAILPNGSGFVMEVHRQGELKPLQHEHIGDIADIAEETIFSITDFEHTNFHSTIWFEETANPNELA